MLLLRFWELALIGILDVAFLSGDGFLDHISRKDVKKLPHF